MINSRKKFKWIEERKQNGIKKYWEGKRCESCSILKSENALFSTKNKNCLEKNSQYCFLNIYNKLWKNYNYFQFLDMSYFINTTSAVLKTYFFFFFSFHFHLFLKSKHWLITTSNFSKKLGLIYYGALT